MSEEKMQLPSVTRRGETVTFQVPCPNHRLGCVLFVTTRQAWLPYGEPPMKKCKSCGGVWPVVTYLKTWEIRKDGYLYWTDDPRCWCCVEPDPLPLHKDASGRLRMRIDTLHKENGEPVRLFDQSRRPRGRHWRACESFGIRLMTKDGNVLRFQPRMDRTHDLDGHAYGKTRSLFL